MTRWITHAVVLVALVVAACGGDDDQQPAADTTTTSAVPDETTSAPTTEGESSGITTTSAPTTTQAEGSDPGGGTGTATVVIGDETWSFGQISLCGTPASPEKSAFALIAKEGDWQLVAEVVDDTGEKRLEGAGVYDTITLQNNADPTQTWIANFEMLEEKFIVIDGPKVTADTSFDAVTGLADDTPGSLDASCP